MERLVHVRAMFISRGRAFERKKKGKVNARTVGGILYALFPFFSSLG